MLKQQISILFVGLSIFIACMVLLLIILPNETSQNFTRVPYAVDEKIVLLFWSNLWGVPAKRSEGFLEKGNDGGKCPVACEVTSNHSRIKDSHAFVVHARDPYPLPPNKDIPWVLTSLENPVYTPVLKNPAYMSQFHLLRSYRLDSDFPTPAFTKPSLDLPIPFKNKTGGIMVAFSNCERVRTEYLRQLMKFIKIDSYGGCLRNKKGLIERYGADFKKKKLFLQKSYKFAITFFNQDCDYFVDDQILHALNAGAVPIVMSTDKIYDFLPGNLRNSIVNVRDFKNPADLAEHLKFLMNNETEYNKYLEWKTKGLGDISGTIIGSYWNRKFNHWCQVCQAIAQKKWHKQGLKVDECQPRQYNTWGIHR
ncbi:alpha-(1,3)-fucosyltransferase B-like [Dendronephthya gigantea]|uniref:alpha-(1,3)-fucosyltransferase B-like n=1 Tax=Dendronephthya gigantea TaxID=151771 RepID=UPI00106953F7|nr:alpha-(1,3)-fucosyltransferase B-like [Dendronephthya gigantea]